MFFSSSLDIETPNDCQGLLSFSSLLSPTPKTPQGCENGLRARREGKLRVTRIFLIREDSIFLRQRSYRPILATLAPIATQLSASSRNPHPDSNAAISLFPQPRLIFSVTAP